MLAETMNIPVRTRLCLACCFGLLLLLPSAGSPGSEKPLVRASGVLKTQQEGIWCVDWKPTGWQLATAGEDGTVRIWDPMTLREITKLKVTEEVVYSARWSPDGTRLVCGGEDGSIQLYDTETWTRIWAAKSDNHVDVFSLDWSPKGKLIACAGYGRVVNILDAASGKVLHALNVALLMTSVRWGPEGLLAASDVMGNIVIWDETWREFRKLDAHGFQMIQGFGDSAVAWHPDCRRVAVTSGFSGGIDVWRLDTRVRRTIPNPRSRGFSTIAWSPNGKYLVIPGKEGAEIRDEYGDSILQKLPGTAGMLSAAWHPSGNRLATATDDGEVRLWMVTHKR